MPKFIVLQGLPASGKTTKARQIVAQDPNNWIRINNDDIRLMLWGVNQSYPEDLITDIREGIIYEAISSGKNIVIDNINLNPDRLVKYREIAKLQNYDYEEMLIATPLSLCIMRDKVRPNSVGEMVIRRFAKMLPNVQPVILEQNPNLPHCILCDLDGTLALNLDGRGIYDRDFENDVVNEAVLNVIFGAHDQEKRIIFLSGRKEKFRKQTTQFLERKCGFTAYEMLLMRPDTNNTDDTIVKKELYDYFIKDRYYVEFILDDRDKVVNMWRSLGLTVFQVANGDF